MIVIPTPVVNRTLRAHSILQYLTEKERSVNDLPLSVEGR